MIRWVVFGTLSRVFTRSEGFVLRCRTGLSSYLAPDMTVWFIPPELDVPRSASIASVRPLSGDEVAVTFCEEIGAEDAGKLVGKRILVDAACLPQTVSHDTDDLRGYAVSDRRFGLLGTVSDVLAGPAQRILVVSRLAEAGSEADADVLIPFVDAFVQGIDDAARTIRVSIPQGLLTLGASHES